MVKRTANWKDIDLEGKCGSCQYFRPYIKKDTLTARGHCGINKKQYRQRTETCLKHKKRTS